ncbi:hypothetical protein F4821DRAFT_235236, partial [Hypoxylon rubiginosum]
MHFSKILLPFLGLYGSALSAAVPEADLDKRAGMTLNGMMRDGDTLNSVHPYGNTITIHGINAEFNVPVQPITNVMRVIDDVANRAAHDTGAPWRSGRVHGGSVQLTWDADGNNSGWWPNFNDWQTLLYNAYRLAEEQQANMITFNGWVRDTGGSSFNVVFYVQLNN